MDGLHRVYVVLAQRNDPLTRVLRISAEQSPGPRAFPAMDRSSLCPFTPGKKEWALFRPFPVLTTASAGALKWRNPRSQESQLKSPKPEKLRTRLIDNHDKYLRRDQREGKPDSYLSGPAFRPSGRD